MPPDAGVLYAIQAEGTPSVKIGWTRGPVEKRLKSLQTGHPFPLTLLAVVRLAVAPRAIESQVHALLGSYRQQGEWFALRLQADMLQALVTLAEARWKHTQLTRRFLAVEPALRRREMGIARALAEKRGRGRPPKVPQPSTPAQEELVRIRQALGLSARDFAARMGVQVDTVYRWENGHRAVPLMAMKLARFLLASQ